MTFAVGGTSPRGTVGTVSLKEASSLSSALNNAYLGNPGAWCRINVLFQNYMSIESSTAGSELHTDRVSVADALQYFPIFVEN